MFSASPPDSFARFLGAGRQTFPVTTPGPGQILCSAPVGGSAEGLMVGGNGAVRFVVGGARIVRALPLSATTDGLTENSTLIQFDFDKSDIRPDMRPILDKKTRFLLDHPTLRIQIEGHCDERGTVEYNIGLGHRRALSAKDHLVSLGVSPSRIDTVSYREERPLDSRHHELAWAKNRRVKFNILGGIPPGLN
jgi:peptidoglycan-associated lipoprotein